MTTTLGQGIPEAGSPAKPSTTGTLTPRVPYPAPDSGIGSIEERRARYLADVSTAYRGIVIKAFEGNSRAAGVKAKCLDCSNFQRVEVRHCTVILCPLHPYRPYQQDEAEEVDGA